VSDLENCYWCGEPGVDESMPSITNAGEAGTVWFHNECQLRSVLGGLKHQRHECPCFGGEDNNPPDGMTRYEEAQAIGRLVHEGRWDYG
jgi:hypothetical protein